MNEHNVTVWTFQHIVRFDDIIGEDVFGIISNDSKPIGLFNKRFYLIKLRKPFNGDVK